MRIETVSVLEDRAEVTRKGTVNAQTGLQTLTLEGVAPVLVDKTLTVKVTGPGQLVDARVRRRTLFADKDRSEVSLALLEEMKTLEERVQVLRETVQVHSQAAASGRGLLELTHKEVVADVSWGQDDPEAWEARVEKASTYLREASTTLFQAEQALELAEEEQARLQARIDAAHRPNDEMTTDLEIVLEAERHAELEIEVRYLVPGACWRPIHVAELGDPDATGQRQLNLRTEACLWQNTGEDWTDVALRLSTERPSLGATPPELRTDALHIQPKPRDIVVETREDEIEYAGLGLEARRIVDVVPGIDDGGEPKSLRASGRADIPSDGRPVRVPLNESPLEVELSWVLMAELAPQVFQKTVQTNRTGQPLLPGPVELLRNGGLVGQTTLPFVADGEQFELGWGPEPELRVARTETEAKTKKQILSSWTSVRRIIQVHLSNLGPEPRTLEVVERVPVSELEKVRIVLQPTETTGAQTPDDDGFLRWTVTVPGFGRTQLQHGYELQKHGAVVGL